MSERSDFPCPYNQEPCLRNCPQTACLRDLNPYQRRETMTDSESRSEWELQWGLYFEALEAGAVEEEA